MLDEVEYDNPCVVSLFTIDLVGLLYPYFIDQSTLVTMGKSNLQLVDDCDQ